MWLLGCAFAVAVVVTAGSFDGFKEVGMYQMIYIRCGKPLMLKIYNSRTVNALLNLPHMHLIDDVFIRNGKLTAFAVSLKLRVWEKYFSQISLKLKNLLIQDAQVLCGEN
ncbi:unnamed protein product [Gongylonema pulchrum]|uniref:Secreted protein n=1 Tax=Gongylonema pulchrum TaxID=637853 RepID=A0A183DJF1_9BILA|nr:unnamed protein product [Gongylonema pulchrum]